MPGPARGPAFRTAQRSRPVSVPGRGLIGGFRFDPIPKYASAFSFGSAALMGARGFSSFLRSRSVFRLKQEADGNPGDVEKQLSLYECWVDRGDTNKIISRYQSGNYAYDDRVVEIYAEAYESVHGQMPRGVEDRIGRAATRPQMGRGTYQGSSQYDYAAGARRSPDFDGRSDYGSGGESRVWPLGLGSKDKPIFVSEQPRDFKHHASRLFWSVLTLCLGLSLFYFVLNKMGGGAAVGLNGLTKKEITPVKDMDKKFDDVKGCKEAKEELQEIVEFLKNPEKFQRLGGNLPKGVLLLGPPGTGKTLLAKAIAGEAEVPFFFASGSEFEEMYVGLGARRVRELFTAAKEAAPCIIFIDEIDAVGGQRKGRESQTLRQTLNQLLVELDGFETNSGVIVIGATNFADSLDKALTRSGRFDRHIQVPLPDVRGRKDIIQMYADKLVLGTDVKVGVLARGTPGYSGASLATMVNDAAIHASLRGAESVTHSDFEWAKEKMFMGPERKSMFLDQETRKVTAYHEGGHALVAMNTDGADPVHKATIMPRGRALGLVFQLPKGDQTSKTRKQLIADMDVCLAGRIAEEMMFGKDNVTTGASSDMQKATQIAKAMVLNYGMSEKVGFISVPELDKESLGQKTLEVINDEIHLLLDDSKKRVTRLLHNKKSDLDRLAKALMEHESLTGEQVEKVLQGKRLQPPAEDQR